MRVICDFSTVSQISKRRFGFATTAHAPIVNDSAERILAGRPKANRPLPRSEEPEKIAKSRACFARREACRCRAVRFSLFIRRVSDREVRVHPDRVRKFTNLFSSDIDKRHESPIAKILAAPSTLHRTAPRTATRAPNSS